jgi:hypothetical protein
MNYNTLLSIFTMLNYFTEILSQITSCPMYNCVDNQDTICTSVKTGINTTGYNVINLTNICQEGEICHVPIPQWQWLPTYKEDQIFSCAKQLNDTVRFPGEDCKYDKDCLHSGIDKRMGKCLQGKCTGYGINESCHNHAQCLKGLYCNNNTCQRQKTQFSNCTSSFECLNSLLCHNNHCNISAFSLPIGTELSNDDEFDSYYKCILVYSIDNKCTSVNQTDIAFNSTYVPCEMNQKCNYTYNGLERIQGYCDCGFNREKQGYCWPAHNNSM